MTYISDVYKLS